MPKLDFAIIASKKDAAGVNIAGQLRKMQKFPARTAGKKADIFLVDNELINCENIDKEIDAGIFIFASRHVSEAKVHSLTVHSIGNWGAASRGGSEKSLVSCPSALMKAFFNILEKRSAAAKLDYEVVQEATHHGPYLEKPAVFIEIGSDEKRWKDFTAGKIVAETIMEAIGVFGSSKVKSAVGLGGPHYASNFRKVMLSDELAVGYICPKHSLELLDGEMLRQAMLKSVPKADSAILDWKGLGKEKGRIVQLLRSLNITYRRTSEFRHKH